MFSEFFSYEKILLILGVAMFLVMLLGLLIFIIRKDPINKLYWVGFFIPILMIAYPSVQRVSFLNDFFTLEKKVEALEQNPNSQKIREDMKQALKELEKRPVSAPDKLVEIGKAHLLLDEFASAEKYVDKALEQQPDNEKAQKVKNYIELERSARNYQQNPADSTSREKLIEQLHVIEEEPDPSRAEKQIIRRSKELIQPGKLKLERE